MKIFKFLTLLILSVLIHRGYSQVTDCARSQKQADLWYFGEKAGIDFRSGTAVALTDEDVMNALKSTSVISDSNGVLQFFTDGKSIWDRNFSNPTYAPSLLGDRIVTQPCLIVPRPGDSNQYYIFTVDVLFYRNPPADTNNAETDGLSVSLFNMNGNNGLGDGTLRWNMKLLSKVSQKLTAVKHRNNVDYWLIAHEWDNDAFYAYPVTESGIGNPVISHAGVVHGNGRYGQSKNNSMGYMKMSPDGSKLAVAVSGKNVVELFDFDNASGTVSSPRDFTFNLAGINPYGIEFSQDGRMLYTTLLQLNGNGPPGYPSRLYQFDLSGGLATPVLIDSLPGQRIAGMQLANDGRIYVSRTITHLLKKDSLDVIYNPTRPGKACNYNTLNDSRAGFSLAGRNGMFGLPNFVQSYFNRPMFRHDSVCDGEVTLFTITNKANIDSVVWTFGDGGTSTTQDAMHKFSPGNYTVRLKEFYKGIGYTDSVRITVFPLPNISLGGDTVLMYTGSSLNLYAGDGFRDYLWSTTAKSPAITVTEGGNYWARVEDDHCCYNRDTVFVNVFEYYVPTAFTPDDDGLNDVFRMRGLYNNITFQMLIYDRWGKICFESDNMNEGWDGKINGKPAPAGTYVWIVNVDFPANDIVTNGKVVLKGTVILVR